MRRKGWAILGRRAERALIFILFILLTPADLLAATAYVGALSGRIYRVPPSGVAELITQLPGPIGALSHRPGGGLFACASTPSPRIFTVAENGTSAEISAGLAPFPCSDSVVSEEGRLFVLLSRSPDKADEIWEVPLGGGGAHLVANPAGVLLPDGGVLGFSLGTGGIFLLPTQEQTLGRVLRATVAGNVSVFFSPSPPLNLLVDASSDSAGALFILSQEKSGPNSNNRSVLRLDGGVLTTVAGADLVGDDARHLSVGAGGEIFVIGGGYGGGDPDSYLQRILPGPSATIVTTFPSEALSALDDDQFEPFTVGQPAQVPAVSSPVAPAGLLLSLSLAALLAVFANRRRGPEQARRARSR